MSLYRESKDGSEKKRARSILFEGKWMETKHARQRQGGGGGGVNKELLTKGLDDGHREWLGGKGINP